MKTSKSVSPRVQRNRNAATASILEAARAIMREEGVAALSMHELARRVEMRAPSLYNYFSSKMEIYDALFRLGITLWKETLAKVEAESNSIEVEIRNVITSYMTFALENPDLYQLCFERPVPGFVPSQESLDLSFGVLNAARQRLRQFKQELNTELTVNQIVDLVIAISHGLTAMHLANEPHLPVGKGRFGSLIPAAMNMLDAILVKSK
ncbi:MAG: TetR/AcrR family transcriptional regulator [Chloroflexota bacterium]